MLRFFKQLNIIIGALILAISFCNAAYATTTTTFNNGGGDSKWSNASNWSNGVPSNSKDAVIPSAAIGSGYNVSVDVAAVCASLTIGDGTKDATVTISGNNSINITTAGGGTGNLAFNTGNQNRNFTLSILVGAAIVEGSLTTGTSTTGTNAISLTTGSILFTKSTGVSWPSRTNLTVSGAGGTASFTGPLTLSDASSVIQNTTSACTINFNGGLTLSGSANTSSLITRAGETINMGGSLNVSGSALTFNASSNVIFTATATITPTATITFGNLQINNGSILTLAGNITAGGTLTMTSGNINLAGNTLTLGTSSDSPGALSYSAGWMYGGNFTRYMATNAISIGNTAGHFPMGSSSAYRPLFVANTVSLASGGSVTVSHSDLSGSSPVSFLDASLGSDVLFISNSYWSVSTSGISISGTAFSLRLQGEPVAAVSGLDLVLVGSAVGTYAPYSGTTANPLVNRTELTLAQLNNSGGTQQWHFGFTSNSPLPIELLSFNAELKNKVINLSWTTATEKNNDYFTIERTSNGYDFEEVIKMKGAGNSEGIQNYYSVDENPLKGISYYRLKQTDFDGKFAYSELVRINNVNLSEISTMSLFPNPSSGENVFVSVKNSSDEEALITVYDVYGNKVYSKAVLIENGNILTAVNPSDKLSSGTYLITVASKNQLLKTKLIIN